MANENTRKRPGGPGGPRGMFAHGKPKNIGKTILRLCGYLAGIGIRRLGLLLPRIDLIYCEGFRCGMARHGLPIADSDIHLTKNTDLSHYVAPVHRMLEEGNLPEALVVASYAAADFCTEMFRSVCRRISGSSPSPTKREKTIPITSPCVSIPSKWAASPWNGCCARSGSPNGSPITSSCRCVSA